MKRIPFILTFLFAVSIPLYGQDSLYLEIESIDSASSKSIQKDFPYKNLFQNKLSRHRELQKYLSQLYSNGYLAASFDSLFEDSLKLTAYINPGNIYKWAIIKKGNVDEGILSKIGFREKLFSNKPIQYFKVRKLHEDILTWCENNGYPFASVKLDSFIFSGNLIEARLDLAKNIEVIIDSIVIRGDAKISPVYIYNHIGIKPGDPYNELLISKIGTRLKELPFLKETKPVQVIFSKESDSKQPCTTKIVINAAHKKASRFNGILGILPNNKTTGKVLLTGQAQLLLKNPFGRGVIADFNWRKLNILTQDLKIGFEYPFVLSSPSRSSSLFFFFFFF